MRALVVYESMYGNTRAVAETIAEGLAEHGEVQLLEVQDAPQGIDGGIDLLVVGGPTHAHGMSRMSTRKSGSSGKQPPVPGFSPAVGIREWLTMIDRPSGSVPTAAAAFDTRFAKARWLTGSAARGAATRLERLGFRLISPPMSFFVTETAGPLAEGEAAHARRWGSQLAGELATAAR